MGFSVEQAKHGLEQCNGSIERAIDWLFNHADETEEQPVANVGTNSTSSGTNFSDLTQPQLSHPRFSEYMYGFCARRVRVDWLCQSRRKEHIQRSLRLPREEGTCIRF
jgi:hypothetical protein